MYLILIFKIYLNKTHTTTISTQAHAYKQHIAECSTIDNDLTKFAPDILRYLKAHNFSKDNIFIFMPAVNSPQLHLRDMTLSVWSTLELLEAVGGWYKHHVLGIQNSDSLNKFKCLVTLS